MALLKERLWDHVKLIVNGRTRRQPDDSLAQGFTNHPLQPSGLLGYNAPTQVNSSTLSAIPVWRSSALPTSQQIYSLLQMHIVHVSSLLIRPKSEHHRSLNYSDREIP